MVEEVGCLRQTGIVLAMPSQSVVNPTAASANPTGAGVAVTNTVISTGIGGTGHQNHIQQQQQQPHHSNPNPHPHPHLQQHHHQQQQQHQQLASNMSMLNVKGSAGGRYLWTDRELLMHLQNYTPLILLIDFVEKTRTKRFYESSERYEILMLVFIMRKGAPFCENKRFPAEYWVNLSVGPIAEAFDRLQAAIDIPDPQLPIHMSVTDLTSWKQMFDVAMVDIRRYAYYTDPMQLADAGVYNRITFEQRFGMQWQD